MKRIAIDIRPLLEVRRGGVATYAMEMTRALVAEGNQQYALFSNAWQGRNPLGVPAQSPKVEHCFTQFPNRLLNAGFRIGYPRLENLIGEFDALWLPNLNFIATKKPYVLTVHDLSFHHMPRFFTAKQRAWHCAIGVHRLLHRAAHVIAVSEHTKMDVAETYGISLEKISVATPAVSSSYFPAPESETFRIRKTYGLDSPFFLFLAAIEPRKNIEGLIAAYELCKTDADLVIAGGRGWLSESIYARAAVSSRRNRIKFIGYVPEADKPALYSSALAFVYPSFYEGFGMPPLEAMACGVPVVASRASSLGEVVGDAGLLVDPYNASEIALAMDSTAESSNLRKQLIGAGLLRSAAFTWKKSANTLSDALRRISI